VVPAGLKPVEEFKVADVGTDVVVVDVDVVDVTPFLVVP